MLLSCTILGLCPTGGSNGHASDTTLFIYTHHAPRAWTRGGWGRLRAGVSRANTRRRPGTAVAPRRQHFLEADHRLFRAGRLFPVRQLRLERDGVSIRDPDAAPD